jgi:hypothetical protein
MDNSSVPHDPGRRRLAVIGIAVVLGLLMGVLVIMLASASTQLDTSGYLDFSYPYGPDVVGDPTGEKPESKLWWNDGFWWGVLFNHTISETHIYRLDWGAQTWEDTGVLVDDRPKTKSDALWDSIAGKLYIVSHNYTENAAWTSNSDNYGRLYRYTYDQATRAYTLDSNFPVNVNQHETETLVLEKASNGRLWVTFVSRPGGSGPDHVYEVYANTSDNDGLTWGNPFTLTLPVTPTAVSVAQDDISSVIAFDDGLVHKIGIMWSNQISGTLNFATHTDGVDRNVGWTHDEVPLPENTSADDHISLKSTSDGVFAAIKLNTAVTGTVPLIGMVTYEPVADEYSFHTYSTETNNDTRPIMVIDESANKAYIFVSGKPGGSKICYKSLTINHDLSAMGDFPAGDCGTSFIEDNTLYKDIDNATSMKANASDTTGIVVLAGDDTQHYYVHGTMGTPPPVLIDRGPAPDSTDILTSALITATFNQAMDDTTFDGNVTVDDGSGPSAGGFTYSGPDQLMTFTPTNPLLTNDTYTVTFGAGVESLDGVGLYGAPVEWSFSTVSPTVTFSDTSQVALEDAGTITLTVDLSSPSALDVTVPFTLTGTADQGVGLDYTITPTDSLVIPAGSSSGDIVVTINDDAIQENSETVIATMGTPTNATKGLNTQYTATIVDNDGTPTVLFSQADYSEGESGGTKTIEVILSHASITETITVDYATSNGTAVAGSDYSTNTGTLTFNPGVTSQTFDVSILPDTLDEPDETVDLTLTNPTNASLGSPAAATLTIQDDDNPVQVKFDSSTYSVAESAGLKVVTVVLSSASGQTVKVDYTTSDGTATAGSDYTAVNGTLTFAPGVTSQTFNVPVLVDGIPESDETVNLTLSTPVLATLGTPSSAVLTITNDDMFKVYMPVMMKNK